MAIIQKYFGHWLTSICPFCYHDAEDSTHNTSSKSLLTLFHCLFSCNNADDTWGVKLTKGSLQDKKNLFQLLGSFQFFR